jgi:hypothetical protein
MSIGESFTLNLSVRNSSSEPLISIVSWSRLRSVVIHGVYQIGEV